MPFRLAQVNVARLLYPLDDPRMADFVGALDRINQLAEESPGFVWRLQSGSGNATDIPWSDDPVEIVNMSVWNSPEDLKQYVYRSGHLEYYLRRGEWFEKPSQPNHALWWVPHGHHPTLDEARARLEHFQKHGPTSFAFWFSKLYPMPVDAQAWNSSMS